MLPPDSDGNNRAGRPKRIQRKRTKGWRMPDGAKYVGRPSRWGNPFTIHRVDCRVTWGAFCYEIHSGLSVEATHVDNSREAHQMAVELYLQWLDDYHEMREAIRRELAGHDLACWCPLDYSCHADVLLEIANGGGR
jgi:hypothetical protein